MSMALRLLITIILFSSLISTGSAQDGITRTYSFQVVDSIVRRLGTTKKIVTVNGMFPGPTIYANDGDRLLISLTNSAKYKMSIHWHGIRQKRTPWFDGPAFVTQCPLKRGQTFLYNFTVDEHMGTLFWHAHIMWLRATVYGAIVIYPKKSSSYPFKNPYEEHMILLGEWWNNDVQAIEEDALRTGAPNQSDAYTINGYPGPLYAESDQGDVYNLNVITGKRYLLRIINAALNTELFFSIANHTMTVVEVDAEYTKPYTTQTIVLTPGQTTNVLVTADQNCGKYFMSASPYMSAFGVPYTSTPASAVFEYIACNMETSAFAQPNTALQPLDNDTAYATQFNSNLRSLSSSPNAVPQKVDKEFFMTIGLGIRPCLPPGRLCKAPGNGNFTAAINNNTFSLPKISLMHAYYYNISGIYTTDFPDKPEAPFDYTGAPSPPADKLVSSPQDGTRISVIPFGSDVQMIFQNTNIVGFENHPIHLHGYNFYIVGHGFGNYDASTAKLNLVDPALRNTVGVPSGGWAVIRFKADNPGIWYMHCHLEIHTTWGLATAFLVTNGKGSNESVTPPPDDFPKC